MEKNREKAQLSTSGMKEGTSGQILQLRKDDKTTVLCEKKISKCEKEATGCL